MRRSVCHSTPRVSSLAILVLISTTPEGERITSPLMIILVTPYFKIFQNQWKGLFFVHPIGLYFCNEVFKLFVFINKIVYITNTFGQRIVSLSAIFFSSPIFLFFQAAPSLLHIKRQSLLKNELAAFVRPGQLLTYARGTQKQKGTF